MARMDMGKPGTGKSFLGLQEVGILSFFDKRDEGWQWAQDVAIEIEFKGESEYPYRLMIGGNFDRDAATGNIKANALTRKLAAMFETLGLDVGLDLEGHWVQGPKDERVFNIVQYLNDQFPAPPFPDDPPQKYLIYVYKKWNKKKGKYYTNVWPYFMKNTSENKQRFIENIERLKKDGLVPQNERGDEQPNTGGANGQQATDVAF